MIEESGIDGNEMTGVVSKIQRLAIHDGPGIRTIVFLKGCPLKCLWCSSPETQSKEFELLHYPQRCIACDSCLEACEENTILVCPEGKKMIDRSRCTVCGGCVEVCYAEALQIVGEKKSVAQVLREVGRDRIFYDHSNGGVTISGGEPLQQAEFTRALLCACRKAGIHTAMETSGFQSWDLFETVLDHLDLLLYDLKQMDPKKHRRLTGVSNEMILENLKRALAKGVQTVIRYPVIPGFNEDDENVIAMCRFLHTIDPVKRIDLLPYHRFGEAMYRRLGRDYDLGDLPAMAEEELAHMAETFIREGFKVQIGG